MRTRERQALAKARQWLDSLPIPGGDSENQILRLFALTLSRAAPARICAIGRKLDPFSWFHYAGDPVPAMVAQRALKAAGFYHPSLGELESGYRSLLSDSDLATPLLCRLLAVPFAPQLTVRLPAVSVLVNSGREQILEVCRLVMLATSAGSIPMNADGAEFLPPLALSYARDWDLQTSCALVRCCAYLDVLCAPECRWTIDWLLDQQMKDGRFGLIRAEAAERNADVDDWQCYFERTIHAVWALVDMDLRGEELGWYARVDSNHRPFAPEALRSRLSD